MSKKHTCIKNPPTIAEQVHVAIVVKICHLTVLTVDPGAFLTTRNNTRQCFYQSKTVDSFWPVNVLKVWQCLTFKCIDIPWQVYQHFDRFWPLQSQKGLLIAIVLKPWVQVLRVQPKSESQASNVESESRILLKWNLKNKMLEPDNQHLT